MPSSASGRVWHSIRIMSAVMTGESRVRGTIRLKLETGLLPWSESGRVWAGPGANEVCSACDDTITTRQKLYEWEHDGSKIVMHLRCYELWTDERQQGRGPGA